MANAFKSFREQWFFPLSGFYLPVYFLRKSGSASFQRNLYVCPDRTRNALSFLASGRHGTPTGELCFEDLAGKAHSIEPDALAALFEQFSCQVNCVVLNACYAEIQAKAIAKHIKYVIGMMVG